MSSVREWLMRRVPRAVWKASAWRGLHVMEDVPYAEPSECRLDVLRRPDLAPAAPVVLHIHGGGFRVLSKETHGYPVARYAHAGFLTINVNYRLAPGAPYPAAVEDAHAAYAWAVRHVAALGGDPRRILVTGESAGGNLALGLCLSACLEREESWAQALRALDTPPMGAHIAYGFLEATDANRGIGDPVIDRILGLRLEVIEKDYLGGTRPDVATDYADPIRVLEHASPAELRRLPPLLALCGTWDVIARDTRRLVRTLERAGADVEPVWIEQAVHGFHALPGLRSERAWTALLAHAQRLG